MDAPTLENTRDVPSGNSNVTLCKAADSQTTPPKISSAGAGALLFDPGTGRFDAQTQARLQAMAKRIESTLCTNGTAEVVLGVNNVMLIFNPLELHPNEASAVLTRLWETTDAQFVSERVIEIPVIYGGKAGEDLLALSNAAGLGIEEYVRCHSKAMYSVACIGSMPGFAYMAGLPPELAVPRRKVPRMKVEQGTVIVGGTQAGAMPCTAPSGWHLLGRTDSRLFNAMASPPCLFSPGDTVQFIVKDIDA